MERDETMRNALSRKFYMELIPPGSGDAVADLDRLLSALKKSFGDVVISQSTFRRDYMLLRDFDWKLTVTMIPKGHEWEIVRIQRGDTTDKNFGYAVDLGSTTVVMQLVDLNTGNSLGQESVFNAQIPYGSEILSRIFYVKDHPERLKELQACTLANIRQLMDALERKTGVLREDCSVMAVAGNTTMVHFLLGYDPWFIFHAPYAPAFGSCGFIPSQDLDLPFPGLVTCLPSVANYVGGDVVSGLLASGLYQSEEISLYMDIGTNGEMVLETKTFCFRAAGAAGPALEGGISRQGMPARSALWTASES
jgi:uncharacterized 2Fe-2S/4Fe-4S cluster protein (DUF4445 family)